MTTSSNLQLPYLAPAQAQKHVTVNEALRRLDALVQLAVVSATTTAQPASPGDGDVYILPAGKTGAAWGAMANHALAYWRDGAWEQITPREGWLAYARDVDQLLAFTGTAWTATGGGASTSAANTWAQRQSFSVGVFVGTGTPSGIPVEGVASNENGFAARFQASPSSHAITYGGRLSGNFNPWIQGLRNDGGDVRPIVLQPFGGAVLLGTAEVSLFHAGAAPIPAADNTYALGAAGARFTQLFAATGAINTSDATEKTPLAPPSEALRRVAARIRAGIGVFQWLSSVAAKGPDGARRHIGITAQAVQQAFEAEGLSPWDYGLFCADPATEWVEVEPARISTEAGFPVQIPARFEERPKLGPDGVQALRLGVRYDQLLLLLAAAGLESAG